MGESVTLLSPRRYAPQPVPDAVTDFLQRLDLGYLIEGDITAPVGRNDIWAGHTSSGAPVLVKRLTGGRTDVLRRVRRLSAMGALAAVGGAVPTPEWLGGDEESGLVAYRYLDGARTGDDLATEDAFDAGLMAEAGRILATLHATDVPDGVRAETALPVMPPLDWLDAIPWARYVRATAGELHWWRLLQNDRELAGALARLRRWEADAPVVLAHGDIRLDQFLVHDGRLYLTDMEECHLGDAARDIGALAGEFVARSVLGMRTPAGLRQVGEDELTANGARRLQELSPLVTRFVTAYLDERPGAREDAGLMERATAFAGWHLFDRTLAAGSQSPRLAPIQLAMAGIGRQALLRPELYAAAVGLAVPA